MAHIHFNQILIDTPITHMQMSWTHPDDRQGQGFTTPEYWMNLARKLEEGCFDGIFFADTLSVPDDYEAGAIEAIKAGSSFPRQDPFALIPVMAHATRHIGFGVTLTTAGTPPFLAVRRLGTLDNLSGGRVAWNVVTSHMKSDFRAMGLAQPGHDDRYDQADEYMEICYRLWDGFPADALVRDRESGVFVDVSKIKRVDFDGKYYNCHAYPVSMQSPQGRPLIFQAGQSPRGMQFAATHADAVYGLPARLESMKSFMQDIRTACQTYGDGREPKVFFGVQPIIGGTEEEAARKRQELAEKVPIEAALSRLSGMIGIDLGKFDLDEPLSNFESNASRGLLAATMESLEGRVPTVREAAIHWGMAVGMPQFTGTPEQVADWIQMLWQECGCYGFNISPTISPQSVHDFVDQVVPILQKRGLMRTEYAGTTFRENLTG